MPLGGRSANRLDMLINVSVHGHQDADKLATSLKRSATSMQDVTTGLRATERGSEQARANYQRFSQAADQVFSAQQQLSQINRQLADEEQRLSQLKQQSANISTQAAQEIQGRNMELIETYQRLRSNLEQVNQISPQTFQALGESAVDARVDVSALQQELERTISQLEEHEQLFQHPRDPRTGQFAAKDRPGEGIPRGEEPEHLRREGEMLRQRMQMLQESIRLSEELNERQRTYAQDRERVIQANREVDRQAQAIGQSEQQIGDLEARKRQLIQTIQTQGQAINEMAGTSLVHYNEQTQRASINTQEIIGVKQAAGQASERLGQSYERATSGSANFQRAQSQTASTVTQTTQAAADQNQEWDVLRQRISRNNEALWGLRRQLGALRNQILVVLFATRGLRNMFQQATDAIVEAESSMRALEITSRSVNERFDESLDAARRFSQGGLMETDDAARSLKTILDTGIGLDQASELMEVFTDAAAVNTDAQTSVTDAVQRAAEAFRDQRTRGLQAIGISRRLTDMVEEHADALGVQQSELDENQRQMAIYNAVIQEGARFTGGAARIQRTLEGQMEATRVASRDTSEAIGNLLQPILIGYNETMQQAHRNTQEWINELEEGERAGLDRWVERINGVVEGAAGGFSNLVGTAVQLVLQYDRLIVTGAQLFATMTLIDRIKLRLASSFNQSLEALNQYQVATNLATRQIEVHNRATGQSVSGLEAFRAILTTTRVEMQQQIATLQASATAKQTYFSRVFTATRAQSGWTAAVMDSEVRMRAWEVIKTRMNLLWQRAKAPISAATMAVKAFGGALQFVMAIGSRVLAFLGRMALAFVAFEVISRVVTWIFDLDSAMSQHERTLQRLQQEYEATSTQVEQLMDRTEQSFRRAQIWRVMDEEMTRSREVLRKHLEERQELIERFQELQEETERHWLIEFFGRFDDREIEERMQHYQERIDVLEDALQKEQDELIGHQQEVLDIERNLQDLQRNIRDDHQQAISDSLSRHGADRVLQARRELIDLVQLERDHNRELEALRAESITSAELMQSRMADIRVELERQATDQRKEAIESGKEAIEDIEQSIQNTRIELMQEGADRTRVEVENERQERLRGYEELRQDQRELFEDLIAGEQALVDQVRDATRETIGNLEAQTRGLENHGEASQRTRQLSGELAQEFRELASSLGDPDFDWTADQFERIETLVRRINQGSQELGRDFDLHFGNMLEQIDEFVHVSDMANEEQERLREIFGDIFDELDRITEKSEEYNRALDQQRIVMSEVQEAVRELDRLEERLDRATQTRQIQDQARSEIELAQVRLREKQSLNELNELYSESEQARIRLNAETTREHMNRAQTISQIEDELSDLRQLESQYQQQIDRIEQLEGAESHLLETLTDKLEVIQQDITEQENLLSLNRELHDVLSQVEQQEQAAEMARALWADTTARMSDMQTRLNEQLRFQDELLRIDLERQRQQEQVRELQTLNRFVPLLGDALEARRQVNIERDREIRQIDNQLDGLRQERTLLRTQIQLVENYIETTEDLTSAQRVQAQERLNNLEQELTFIDQTIRAQSALRGEVERTAQVLADHDFTEGFVDSFDPIVSQAFDFANSLADIRHDILLDHEKFVMEQDELLRRGELSQRQHNALTLANQELLAEQEAMNRAERIADLVRDVGREIQVFAARRAAQTGNIMAAVGLLAGGVAVSAAASRIARDIEGDAQLRFEQANLRFQTAEQQIREMEDARDEQRASSRSLGGTVQTDSLNVTITPTVTISGEQVFIGSGSATEFSEELSGLIREVLQQSIDDRQIDISNIPQE